MFKVQLIQAVKPGIKYRPVVLVIQLHPHLKKVQFSHILPDTFFVVLFAHFLAFNIFIEFELRDKKNKHIPQLAQLNEQRKYVVYGFEARVNSNTGYQPCKVKTQFVHQTAPVRGFQKAFFP